MRKLVYLLLLSGCPDEASVPPNAPSDLDISPVGGGAHLVWSDNSDNEDNFVILRKTAGADYAEVDRVPFDTRQYHDGLVTPGTAYTYKVTAINDDGMTSSNEVTFTP